MCGVIVHRCRRGIALCARNFSYLHWHPPTIDEISKPMYLCDSKAFEACTVGIDAFLVASSVVSPPPVAFCLFLSSLSFEPFGRPRFRIGIEFSLEVMARSSG